MNRNGLIKVFFTIIIFGFHAKLFSQNISVDASNVIRKIPSFSVGINMNYLMDGTYITSGTQAATATALKNMGMKFLRYPGGEKSDNYLWSTSPYTKAKPVMALTGSCQFPSGDSRFVNPDFITAKPDVLDFDEFVTTYKQVGAEPMIVCAYDAAYYGKAVGSPLPNPCGTKPTLSQLVTNAKEWVKYANVTKGYNIKYWCIGNESWNLCDYNGCVSDDQYAIDIVTFATAMKAVDPTIKIIVNGRGTAWWKTLLESSAANYIDYLGVSCYPIYNYTNGYETYRTTSPDLLSEAQTAVDAINTYASSADKARIKVISTEFNAIDFGSGWANTNDVGHALVAFEILGQHLENPQIDAALFWNTRWITNTTSQQNVYDALDQNSNRNANGLALSIWGNNLLPDLINTASIGTGSNYIKVFADYDDIKNQLNLFVINKDNISRNVNVDISNYISNPFYQRYVYKGANAGDKFPAYTLIDAAPVQLTGYPATFTLARNSITVFKFGISGTLAVNSLLLNAMLTDGKVKLTWKTDADDCESSYVVEGSADGVKWDSLQTLKDSCNSNGDEYNYEEDIRNITANNRYYRIKEIDREGYSSYSNIKIIRLHGTRNEIQIKLYSNPATASLDLEVESGDTKNGDVIVSDSRNNILKKIPSFRFKNRTKINIDRFSKGIYFLEVVTNTSKKTIKFVKL